MLMKSVLGLPDLDFKFALEVVIYHQERNYAAYFSSQAHTESIETKEQKAKMINVSL